MFRARAVGPRQRHNIARMSLLVDMFIARLPIIAVAPRTKTKLSTHRNSSGAIEAEADSSLTA